MPWQKQVLDILRDIAQKLLLPGETACIGNKLHLVEVTDGETLDIIGHRTTFIDIQSSKAKQFGFSIELYDGERLTCCGDEPYQECLGSYA